MTAAAEPPRLPLAVPDWHDQAACRQFPELVNAWHDSAAGSPRQLAARLICGACPVRLPCAIGALERGEPHGIWGGLDRNDRKVIAREYGYPAPSVLPEHGTNSRYAKHGCRCKVCAHAHAVYEYQRRARVRAEAEERRLVIVPPLKSLPPLDRSEYRRRSRRRARRR